MSMITALLSAAIFAAAQDPAPAPATQQEGEGESREGRIRRAQQEYGRAGGAWGGFQDPERQSEMRVRMLKNQLGLTDEQVQKATDIFKQAREAEQKAETESQSKVRELLTDDQKKKYDEMLQNQARSRGPLGGLDRMIDGWGDRLKRELQLDDATFEKVKAPIEEFRKKIQERGEKLRQEGMQNLNWQEEMQKFQEGSKEVGEKIKAHLTPEQKEKYDKMVEQFQQPGRGMGGAGERRGPPTAEERTTRVMEAMKISEAAEAAAVKSAVQKVLEAEHAMGEYDREARGKLDEIKKDNALTDEQVNTKLNEIKTGRLEKDKAMKAAQAALREIISARQELELIQQRVLR